ncbi:MAG: NAD(P)/FAD-dependent oxidoreductase, partial [Nitrosopumilaceae archaeon]|nr:NAD(P)/FAD-dependent oxidoreductase [Nitrosopumilaceae archaeon]
QSKDASELFDGKGGCYIESGRETASVIEVDMFSQPKPSTSISAQTSENLSSKREFEKERLSKWL